MSDHDLNRRMGAAARAAAPVELWEVSEQLLLGRLREQALTDQIQAERSRTAIELEQHVQSQTAHLNSLLEFSRELLGLHSLETVLMQAVRHALVVVPDAQCGAIYLAKQHEPLMELRASHGFRRLPHIRVRSDVGLLGLALTAQHTQRTSSVGAWEAQVAAVGGQHASERVLEAESLDVPPSGVVAVPLVVQHQALGVLLLLREAGEGPFAEDGQATLEGIANLTATAVLEEQRRAATVTLSTQLATSEARQHAMEDRLGAAEAGMLQAARLAAVGQLAASIAHEINNPLYAARNALYLVEEDLPADFRSASYLTMASEQLTRIATIIERMRDFYRPTRGELGPCAINELLEGTLALAGLNGREGGMEMVFVPADDLPAVHGNADQLRQVFLNLVLNAIDAMPEGGTLTVRTEAGPTVVLIEIQDTGIGIPADIQARLFEPFFTNKPNGTGLGLSISAHIVTQHGGQIEIESKVGQGTTFRVILPYGGRGV